MTETTDAALDAIVRDARIYEWDDAAEAITVLRAKVAESAANFDRMFELCSKAQDRWNDAINERERLQFALIGMTAERDKFEAAFWEAEGKLSTMTAERDAALASESAAYARGVHVAAALVARCLGDCWHLDDEKVWPDDLSAMIRALADSPPAPVVGVKPLFFIERRNNMWDAPFGYEIGWNGTGDWFRVKQNGRVICKKIGGFDRAEEWANTHHAARLLAALLPQSEGGE